MSSRPKTRQLRILFVARTYPPLIGGMEKFAEDFYHHLDNIAEVRLIANPIGKKQIVQFFFKVMCFLISHANEFDIIHFNDAILAPLLPIIRFFSRSKVTFTVHGLDIVYRRFGYQYLVIPCLRRADKIFPVSHYTLKQCLIRNISEEKLHIIPNGIDFSKVAPCEEEVNKFIFSKIDINLSDKFILLSLGRLIQRKGHVWFLENVLKRLPERYVYLIAGDGPEFTYIKETSLKENLENRVILLGYVSEEEKACLYQLADAFIMPNIYDQHDQEGFGIVLLEAGSYSLPSIASKMEGIEDAVIDGITGLLVEEKNPKAFIDAILNLKIDRDLIPQRLRERYDWEIISQKYLDQFQILILNK